MRAPQCLAGLPKFFPEIIGILLGPTGLSRHVGLNMTLGFGDQLPLRIK